MGGLKPEGTRPRRHAATARLRDAVFRLIFALFVAVAGEVISPGSAWPAVWFGVMLLVQGLLLGMTWRMRVGDEASASQRLERAYLVCLGLSSVLFATSGVFLWFEGGWGGRLFALFMLASNAVQVVLMAADKPRHLWFSCAPFLIVLQALPIISLVTAAQGERGVMGVMAVAANFLVARLISTGAASIDSSRKIAGALEDAHRERQRAESASAAKSEFLDLMGHELRTPLNGVLGMAQAMAGADLSPEQRRRLEVIRGSGEILLMLVNDVLEFSRMSASDLTLESGEVHPAALCAEIEHAFRPLVEAKGLALEANCLASAGVRRIGDPLRVRQVLRSLMGVAIKSADAGAVSLAIDGDAQEFRFRVTAGGTAAPHADPGEAPFIDLATGPGLALGIARDLVRRMGGDLAVACGPDGTTTYTARMALALQAPVDEPFDRAPSEVLRDAADDRLRVLAAEDNPTNQLVLKTLLQQAGLDVHIVSDGEEAVSAWRNAPWDLVLMDIRMPRMDGMAATRAIRALEAVHGRPRTPIIAVTADAMNHQALEYTAAGMDGLIPKPIQFSELASVVCAVAAAAEASAPQERAVAR